MVTAPARRGVVEQVQAAYGMSQGKAIRFTGFPASTIRYRSVRPPEPELRAGIRELAERYARWGYRTICDLVRGRERIVHRCAQFTRRNDRLSMDLVPGHPSSEADSSTPGPMPVA